MEEELPRRRRLLAEMCICLFNGYSNDASGCVQSVTDDAELFLMPRRIRGAAERLMTGEK
jgi:hypothetical protein